MTIKPSAWKPADPSIGSIGGIKVIAKEGWFAARPSGAEGIYKVYAKSCFGQEHPRKVEAEPGPLFQRHWLTVRTRQEPISPKGIGGDRSLTYE